MSGRPTITEFRLPGATLRATAVGDGPPVLLLHAGGERRAVWADVVAALPPSAHRAIAVDQRGHGESSGSRSDGLPAFAGDVRDLVRSLGAPTVLVGASLGGMAILLAMADGDLDDLVTGVVLVDVVPSPDPRRARRYLRQSSTDRTGDMAESPIARDILAHAAQLTASARRLDTPTLLVRGTASEVTLEDDVARFLQLVPHASVREIEGAHHLVASEAPEALAEVLAEFLDGLGIASSTSNEGDGVRRRTVSAQTDRERE
ncbi:alpha/beta hydrolase [Acidimicrobiia bacterium EGI L10123]|uniref:alpha/beta fold hydrolase n=1 Tax=Salinilacustrithrix flava TaxID=2957203 RepID=UPI003D7C362A|nr:alpha/beta hydrolase [Acidimicrobiia bacterium EGI L10123]